MTLTRSFRLLALSFLGTALAVPLALAEPVVPAAPDGYVLDQADILSEATETQLQTDLAALEAANGSQLVVLTVPSLQGYEPEVFALAVLREWGVGQAQSDNGLVFLICPMGDVGQRAAYIEVGYGLEGAITDAQSYSIVSQVAYPHLITGNYDQAVLETMSILEDLAQGESFAPAEQQSPDSGEPLTLFLFFILPMLWGVCSMFSGTKSWWLGGIFGGVFGAVVFGATGALMGALTGLFVDYILSTYFFGKLVSSGGVGGAGGGFWRGGGSGGGGFGGFGGGSGGGGGAGMRW